MFFFFSRDDDKFGRRERYSGPTSDFKEKDGYKPNVKIEYIDDDGRVLNPKEAFRSAQIIAYLLLK
jgi:U4/U6.U5 tri-snRNP-associated protein 1